MGGDGVRMDVVMLVLGHQVHKGQLPGLLRPGGRVEEQLRGYPTSDCAHHMYARIALRRTFSNALHHGRPFPLGHLVELVDDDQRGRAVAYRRQRAAIHGVEVVHGVDDVDQPARTDPGFR